MPQYPNETAAVENLQRYLRQLSYHQAITPPPIDGIYESQTAQALREFQALYGLPVTGSADRQTWEILYRAYRASLGEHSPPRAVSLFPTEETNFAFRAQSTGFPVSALQYMLLELSALYSELEDVTMSGIYDERTAKAVRTFQQKNALPADGEVGLGTWNALVDQYNLLFASGE